MVKKITPNQAAEVMGCSPQFIRIGMQRNLLDIYGLYEKQEACSIELQGQ